MGFSLFLLGHRPEVQEKIFEELDNIFGNVIGEVRD
jgi:cytochrome P450